MKQIRTRYAPSPTGYLHIGGARTALFSYLFAKHNNGKFIFRIEDTDFARNVPGGEKSQLDNLSWLGIIPDESPEKPNKKFGNYRQSEKLDIYNSYVQKMLEDGTAYKAFDTTDELLLQKEEQEKKGQFSFRYDRHWLKLSSSDQKKREDSGEFVVRVLLPKNKEYIWNDLVRGKISFNSDEIGDWVIKKSDGNPTYNFAVVIDDYEMEISHVFRGEEHIANTPKQLAIYELFNWKKPEFGHLTIITNTEGKKLSKRDTSLNQFIEDYKIQGYCPEAIFNFLALLGWTHENSVELMSREELIKSFDYKRLSKSPSKFDIQKMDWFAKKYMKNEPNKIMKNKLLFSKGQDENWKDIFLNTYKENSKNIEDLQNNIKIYEVDKIVGNYLRNEVTETFKEIFLSVEFNINNIQLAIDQTKLKCNVSGKNLFIPIRQMTTGLDHGPELAKAIFLFGELKVKLRLKNDN
ncbi:MAG: glutamate--tRNA ligase [Mycoplasmataceae bacterium]|nr:glutamate--tRNA ligase [Mycoplasmataceae bacterium]